jgi:hypothetical protein
MENIESKHKKYRVKRTLKNGKNKSTNKALYIDNEKCKNKKTKEEFEFLNKDNNLCICCGEPFSDINECNECTNGHKIHSSCIDKLDTNIITHKTCPKCGLLINKKCKPKENKNGGKMNKKTKKQRKNKKIKNKKIKY